MKSDDFLDDKALRNAILRHIESGKYRLSRHAAEEQAKDDIDLHDTLHVLKTGFHEHKKPEFNNKFKNWHYAIRGRTEDLKTVRVIICFTDEMLIVTVMEL